MPNKLRLLPLLIFALLSISLPAQWAKTNGLPGGVTYNFLPYGDTIVAQVGNEIYFSSNHGQGWVAMPFHAGVRLYRSYSDGQTILAYRYNPSTGTRIVRTDDFGETWQTIASTNAMLFYETLLAYGYIYGSDHNGLYRSNDNGANWEYVTTKQVSNIQFDGQRITGSSYPYLLQSTDGGYNWDTLLQVSGNVISMLQHENHLFAFMQNAGHGCYASSDYGQTWQQYPGVAFDQFSEFIWLNGSIYGLKGNKYLKSPNLGQTWDTISFSTEYYYPASKGIAVGTDLVIGGIYNVPNSILRSTDEGASWSPSAQGITASAGKLRPSGSTLYVPGQGGLYQLAPDGLNWTDLPIDFPASNYGGITDFTVSDGNWIIATGYELRVSLDNGTTWLESSMSGSWWDGRCTRFETIGDKIAAVVDNSYDYEFFASQNHGLAFTLTQQPPSSTYAADIDQGKIYALCANGSLYRSDDVGNQWVQHGIPVSIDSIGGIFNIQLLVRGNVISISSLHYSNKMLYSKDAGQTWTYFNLATAGLPIGDAPFSDLLYIGNYLVGANAKGVFLSQNNGTDWLAWNEDLEAQNITDMEVHEDYLWAATEGNGIWKRSLSELGMKPVMGLVFFDQNGNAQYDLGEPGFPNVVAQSLITNAYINTRPDGTYNLLSNLTQEEIKVNPTKPYWILTPASQSVAVPSSGADFAVHFDPNAQDLSVDLTNASVLRPGFETNYLLSWRNNVPIPASNIVLTLSYPDNLLDLLSTSIPPTTQSGGSLSWNLGNVAPLSNGIILLQFKVPISVPLATEVCATATITPLIGELAPNDNIHERCEIVVGSFDPNDKQAEPSGFLNPVQLANNEPVTYTIRFQNTGNYPATFVRITDTLQQTFEPASFQYISASHPCSWDLRGQGEVEFFFNNIQLPPVTTDEPGSHGFVKYSIRPRQNLPLGTPLRNTAHIFFDFNAPITTNTTETLAGLVRVKEVPGQNQSLLLFPNPASNIVRAETGERAGELILQDATGRVVLRKSVESASATFSVEGLPQGLYQVIFVGEKTMQYGSLVVQR